MRRLWVAAFVGLAGCGADCAAPDCRLSLTAGPGDGATVPAGLEATATAFLGPGTGSGGSGGGTGGGTGLPRLRLDRNTLSPGSGTVFDLPLSRSLGLRAEVSRPILSGLRAYGALSAAAGQQEYRLPQGLGPLTDPMRIRFGTLSLTPEIGVVHHRPLPALPGAALRLSAGAGVALTHTRTHLTSALLDVSSRTETVQPYARLGAGLVLVPRGPGRGDLELAGEARLTGNGTGLVRGEIRLSR